MSSYALRAWVGILGVGTVIAGYRALRNDDGFAKNRFPVAYEEVTPLLLRTYVVSAVLNGATRIVYAISPHNLGVHLATLLSFLLACFHLWSEIDFESIADYRLIVIGASILWMVLLLFQRNPDTLLKGYRQSTFLNLLRLWVGLVGIIAVVNGVQCHLDSTFTARRIYTLMPQQATPLFTRIFGSWTLFAGVLRLAWALKPHSISIYLLVVLSFVLAFIQFIVETTVTHTAPFAFSTISPLIISSGSTLLMFAVWPSLKQRATVKLPKEKQS